jgi:hypothetical protein
MTRVCVKTAIALLLVVGSKSELLGQSSTYSPPMSGPGEDMNVSVTSTPGAGKRSLSVSFTVPDSPYTSVANTIYLYGYQMISGVRANDISLPKITGTWAPGSKGTFSVDLPETYFAKRDNWEIHFCVGHPEGCVASQNLLAGAP